MLLPRLLPAVPTHCTAPCLKRDFLFCCRVACLPLPLCYWRTAGRFAAAAAAYRCIPHVFSPLAPEVALLLAKGVRALHQVAALRLLRHRSNALWVSVCAGGGRRADAEDAGCCFCLLWQAWARLALKERENTAGTCASAAPLRATCRHYVRLLPVFMHLLPSFLLAHTHLPAVYCLPLTLFGVRSSSSTLPACLPSCGHFLCTGGRGLFAFSKTLASLPALLLQRGGGCYFVTEPAARVRAFGAGRLLYLLRLLSFGSSALRRDWAAYTGARGSNYYALARAFGGAPGF